ncbi:SRPBCC domain-containing protein [Chryseobacterium sp.]|uniref:SRPBCC family protein n=1 Tax=Chryseobacterium sp. TaxID=1871047 RepID=UPI0025BD278C|nr:SRPBCC domain-containing protein [Chryseobacterium sp.]
METLSYETEINAPLQKVWDILWGEETYNQWTRFFSPDSTMKSDWKVGGKTYFLNANGEGMVSTIESLNEPHEVIFQHLGMVKDGVEDTQSKDIVDWQGAQEKYFLIDLDGKTKLHAEVQVEREWKEDINTGFIKGLEVVKNLAEQS